jgi:hypothetical protein
MLTRGVIIGKLIDDLSNLQTQVEMRCSVGLTDLNKFCEDFVKDILNVTHSINLKNLNTERSNEPGLDLGDAREKIAFQVTSVATSQKISETLSKITEDQLKVYSKIKVLIIGKKQGKYDAVDKTLMARCGFEITDISDLSDLCSMMVSLKFDELFQLYQLFEKELQVVITEFEIPNKSGEYKTSLSSKLEVVPHTICLSASKFLSRYNSHDLKKITKEFKRLGRLPRVTRDFLKVLITVGNHDDGNYRIKYVELKRKLRIPQTEMDEEISILTEHNFMFELDEDMEVRTRFSDTLSDLIEFGKEENCLQKLLVPLDFTLLDEL